MTSFQKPLRKPSDEAAEALDRILSKHGWRFVGMRNIAPIVIEYEIERIRDGRRATVRRTITDIVMSPIDAMAERASRDVLGTSMSVSLSLAMLLKERAKEVDSE